MMRKCRHNSELPSKSSISYIHGHHKGGCGDPRTYPLVLRDRYLASCLRRDRKDSPFAGLPLSIRLQIFGGRRIDVNEVAIVIGSTNPLAVIPATEVSNLIWISLLAGGLRSG
ncbi:hypothetical protein I7I50_01595 [Histoplasma capsulatum G186AR]|nr:hypothetical protein I7I50_01595 [Histoplasma capsulatum G186AR]